MTKARTCMMDIFRAFITLFLASIDDDVGRWSWGSISSLLLEVYDLLYIKFVSENNQPYPALVSFFKEEEWTSL
jgi:hypothetical protein